MSQDTNLTTDTQSQNTTRKPPPNEPIPQQHSQQTQPVLPLRRANNNNPWGDATHLEKPHNHFQLLSKNVGTLNTTSLDMLAIATGLQELHASMFLGQETNTPWNPKNLQNVASQCHQIYTNKKIATSSSQEKCDGTYQPGGTITLALGRWASRVIDQGCDKQLGRWSYLELVGRYGK